MVANVSNVSQPLNHHRVTLDRACAEGVLHLHPPANSSHSIPVFYTSLNPSITRQRLAQRVARLLYNVWLITHSQTNTFFTHSDHKKYTYNYFYVIEKYIFD